jgi:multimeric flavodoxin WrbA
MIVNHNGESTMQITTLLGSARKKGNTATVLGWMEEELKSQGHSVERVYLNSKTIGGCLGCSKCMDKPDEIACVQKDDAVDIMEQMIASGAILYASPIYFWGFSAQTKALIDRSYSMVTDYQKPGHKSLLKGKRIGLLVTGEDPYEENAEGMFTTFDRLVDYYLAHKAGDLYVAGTSAPDALSEAVKEKALALARSLVE